ncbi:TetR family transcriptional regulator [Sphingopyxis macrogoltabida]|uniref:TetR family transcriptional regulator n=1 Tax=Sphingopyxis macrogoltabida TaxID=33050 RepID=A0AAC9AW84_SPHMC|nr:TetR family transcriptional regulator [Sphingopyxis macrogoltabida]
MIEAALELFSQQGYAATGIKDIAAAASAPHATLYYWFPGGKRELGVAAIVHGGARYRAQLEACYPPDVDVVDATVSSFAKVASLLEASSYAGGCPIAMLVLEVASSDDGLRNAAAEVFETWIEVMEQRFIGAGMSAELARQAAVEIFCLIEGAILLSRSIRSPAPLHIAGQAAANAVAAKLAI